MPQGRENLAYAKVTNALQPSSPFLIVPHRTEPTDTPTLPRRLRSSCVVHAPSLHDATARSMFRIRCDGQCDTCCTTCPLVKTGKPR
eukprot:6178512-Pleurochrysis_carterae.AAC.2